MSKVFKEKLSKPSIYEILYHITFSPLFFFVIYRRIYFKKNNEVCGNVRKGVAFSTFPKT